MSPNRKAVTFEDDTYGSPVRKQRAGALTLAYQKRQLPSSSNHHSLNKSISSKSPPTTPTSIMRGGVERVSRLSSSRGNSTSSAGASSPCVVLHGRVLSDTCASMDNNSNGGSHWKTSSSPAAAAASQLCSIRKNMEQKSKLSELTNEMKQFQKMVAELDSILSMNQSLSPLPLRATPERQPHDEAIEDRNAHQWRARIKIKAAQETDTKLFQKLYNYETTLTRPGPTTIMMTNTTTANASFVDDEVRNAQTACMRLHRDFKQTHKQLVMILSKYYSQQPPQSDSQRSLLGDLGSGVGWTGIRRQGSSCSLSSSSVHAIEIPISALPISTPRLPPQLHHHHSNGVALVTPPISSVSPLQRKETHDIYSHTSTTLNSSCSTTTEEEEEYEEEEELPTEYESTIGDDLCWFCGVFAGGDSRHPNLSSTLREEMDMATNEMMLIGKEVVLKSKHILNDPTHQCSMPVNAFDCGNMNSYHTPDRQQQQQQALVVNES